MVDVTTSEHAAGDRLRPHRHERPYAALVLSGGYEESGADGRWTCQAGDLVMHPPFHLHGNHVSPSGARVLNIAFRPGAVSAMHGERYGVWRLPDPGRLQRLARRDALGALIETLEEAERRAAPAEPGWAARMAEALDEERDWPVGALARRHGVSAEHASRVFRSRYGLAPCRYRAERRARCALKRLASSDAPLADIAADCGYADQPHMSRELRRITGRPPGALRRLLRRDG